MWWVCDLTALSSVARPETRLSFGSSSQTWLSNAMVTDDVCRMTRGQNRLGSMTGHWGGKFARTWRLRGLSSTQVCSDLSSYVMACHGHLGASGACRKDRNLGEREDSAKISWVKKGRCERWKSVDPIFIKFSVTCIFPTHQIPWVRASQGDVEKVVDYLETPSTKFWHWCQHRILACCQIISFIFSGMHGVVGNFGMVPPRPPVVVLNLFKSSYPKTVFIDWCFWSSSAGGLWTWCSQRIAEGSLRSGFGYRCSRWTSTWETFDMVISDIR